MSRLTEPRYQHGQAAPVGVLLLNLGTPDAPTAKAVRSYLRQFLSDTRVVEIPRLIWLPILHGIILNTRPSKSAKKYAGIWLKEGSPLKVYTERQTKLLQGYLGESLPKNVPVVVDYAMRYGNPSVESKLLAMRAQGCQKIVCIPLYPQYAASATASALDAVFSTLQQMRNQPAIRTVQSFHDHPLYIKALAARVNQYWQTNGRPDKIIFSFHGVPQASLDKGDPYHCYCHKTARLLADALGLGEHDYRIAFQSRFGKAAWLKPYLSPMLKELGQARLKTLDVFCPGFVADCLETLEEIAQEGAEDFTHAGGGQLRYIPALNDSHEWIHALHHIVQDNLQGWLQADAPEARALSQQRAEKLQRVSA